MNYSENFIRTTIKSLEHEFISIFDKNNNKG